MCTHANIHLMASLEFESFHVFHENFVSQIFVLLDYLFKNFPLKPAIQYAHTRLTGHIRTYAYTLTHSCSHTNLKSVKMVKYGAMMPIKVWLSYN